MKKIALMLVLLFILSGCNLGGRSTTPTKVDFHTGTSALEMELLKNLPPDEIWEESSATISVEMKNKGAHDIENGVLYLTNIPEQYFDISDREVPFTIEGRGFEYPEGGFGIINFNLMSKKIPDEKQELSVPFRILANYDYVTEASGKICISSDIYGTAQQKNKACTPGDVDFKSGQGAPVSITKIEQMVKPFSESEVEVGLKFTVKNQGIGDVLDKIKIDSVAIGYDYMACTPNEFELENKQGNFVCSVVVDVQSGEYLAPLLVILDYDYSQSLDREITIKRLE